VQFYRLPLIDFLLEPRYDLLCHEGISRALLVFLGKITQPRLRLSQPAELIELRISDSVSTRPREEKRDTRLSLAVYLAGQANTSFCLGSCAARGQVYA
jgi:hypothetical protein